MSRLGEASGQGTSTPRHALCVAALLALAAVALEAALFGIGWVLHGSDAVFLARRAVIWFVVFAVCYVFRPRGRLFSICVVDNPRLLARGLAVVAAIAAGVAISLVVSHPYYLGLTPPGAPNPSTPVWYNEDAQDEYDRMADSLLAGRVYLDVQPPDYLLQMDNPYDTEARDTLQAQTGEQYRWDTAYFKGRYYVYFGVVPCLVFFVPYHLATGGAALPTGTVVIILALCFIVGAAALLSYLARHRFNHARIGAVLLGYAGMLLCSGMLVALLYPSLYQIPILSSLALSVWGFCFWLRAWESGRIRWIVAGSVCIALILGCRPTLAITGCFALLILAALVHNGHRRANLAADGGRAGAPTEASDADGDAGADEGAAGSEPRPSHAAEASLAAAAALRVRDTTHARFGNFDSLLSKKGVVALMVPFVVVGAAIAWYNVVRFGSPLDFGSSYNLTVADMTTRTFDPARIFNGIYNYLLQPPVLSGDFPFLQPADLTTLYGNDYVEPMVGGVLLCYPFLWACLLAGRIRHHRTTFLAVVVLCACATVLAVFDIEVGGLLARYQMDFTFMFGVAAALAVICRSHDRSLLLVMTGKADEAVDVRRRVLLMVLILATALFCVLYSLFLLSSVSGATGTDYFGNVPGAQQFAESFFTL